MISAMKLPYPKMYSPAKMYTLPDDLLIEGYVVEKGTDVILFQTQNFGWVRLVPGCTDKRGFEIPKRLFSV